MNANRGMLFFMFTIKFSFLFEIGRKNEHLLSLKFKIESVPVFKEAFKCIEKGFLTKAHKNNEEYTMGKVHFSEEINPSEKLITFDPQTSGGLLLSVDPQACEEVIRKLSTDFPGTSVVGEVQGKNKYDVYVGR